MSELDYLCPKCGEDYLLNITENKRYCNNCSHTWLLESLHGFNE